MSNYVAKLLDANRLSKDTLKAKEVATMSKRRSAAHDALIGFPPGPKEFRLLAETNTPGGSGTFNKFLVHLQVLSNAMDPNEFAKNADIRLAKKFLRRHASENFICLSNTARHIYQMLSDAGAELCTLLTEQSRHLSKKERKRWPEDKTVSFAMDTGATFTVTYTMLSGFDFKLEKFAAYVSHVSDVYAKFANSVQELIFTLVKKRRLPEFLVIMKYMRKPLTTKTRRRLVLGGLTNRIRPNTDLAALFRRTAREITMFEISAKSKHSWGKWCVWFLYVSCVM